ncbi:MAG: hypothetical protein PVH18_12355, partial [Chloroflexota bacterium]
MNQRTKIIIGVVALIVGALAIGWLYFQISPGAWDDFMADMSGDGASPQPAAQPVARRPSRSQGDLLASGSIEAEEVTLAAEVGGRIVETTADEGDNVAEGAALLRLNQEVLLAQREQAVAAVDQAQAA